MACSEVRKKSATMRKKPDYRPHSSSAPAGHLLPGRRYCQTEICLLVLCYTNKLMDTSQQYALFACLHVFPSFSPTLFSLGSLPGVDNLRGVPQKALRPSEAPFKHFSEELYRMPLKTTKTRQNKRHTALIQTSPAEYG